MQAQFTCWHWEEVEKNRKMAEDCKAANGRIDLEVLRMEFGQWVGKKRY